MERYFHRFVTPNYFAPKSKTIFFYITSLYKTAATTAAIRPANPPREATKAGAPPTGIWEAEGVGEVLNPPVGATVVAFNPDGEGVRDGMMLVDVAVTVEVSVTVLERVVVASVEVVAAAVVEAETVARYAEHNPRPPAMAEFNSPGAVQAPRMHPAPAPWISAVEEHWHPTSEMGQPMEEIADVRQA